MRQIPLDTHHYKGHVITLYPDENAENPRDDDNLGHMLCWHPRYTLGDPNPFRSLEQFEECLEVIEQSQDSLQLATISCPEAFLEDLEETPAPKTPLDQFVNQLDPRGAQKVISLPLYLYDHSGLSMRTGSFHNRFDSGQVGYIYIERAKILAEYGGIRLTTALRKRAEKMLRNEVASYDCYLRGDIVGYQITARNGKDLDSCWGFDDPAHALAEAKAVIDHLLSQTRHRRAPATPRLTAAHARA